MKKTPWFSVNTKPSRVGWYEVTGEEFFEGKIVMRRWNGAGWEWIYPGKTNLTPAAVIHDDKWRGLTSPAK